MNRKVIVAAIASTILLTPAAAIASCTQATAKGTWQVYAISVATNDPTWTQCKVTLSSGGSFSNDKCVDAEKHNTTLTNGSLKLRTGSSCMYSGSFKIAGRSYTITYLTMAHDKRSANGVGTFSGGIFSFQMLKP